MIEGALVYILSAMPPNAFAGCGTVIEGGLIATCRHVWRDALHNAPEGIAPLVEFPRAPEASRRHAVVLAEDCEGDELAPDLVLLRPAVLPYGTPMLQLALEKALETGAAASRARIRRDLGWIEATVQGHLDPALDPEGRRQFTGENRQGYWFVRGSSGAPVFCRGGQQLAGILSLSELGANDGKSPLQEGFVIPATTIRRFCERLDVKLTQERAARAERVLLMLRQQGDLEQQEAQQQRFVSAVLELAMFSFDSAPVTQTSQSSSSAFTELRSTIRTYRRVESTPRQKLVERDTDGE